MPKLKARLLPLNLTLLLGGILLLAIAGGIDFREYLDSSRNGRTERSPNQLEVYFPFLPSPTLDPSRVISVADQVIFEHALAAHFQTSFRRGFMGIMSDLRIDRPGRQIEIRPAHPITDSSGHVWTGAEICESVKNALNGSLHLATESLIQEIECDPKNVVTVKMNYVPINLESLLSMPDFLAFHRSSYPAANGFPPSSGPFFIKSHNPSQTELEINRHYPESLRANQVKSVRFHWNLDSPRELIRNMDPNLTHGAYFFGFAIDHSDLETLDKKGFKTEQFPSEWFIYLGFTTKPNPTTRRFVGNVIDGFRSKLFGPNSLGQPAYSISPSDRAFGVQESNYQTVLKAGPDRADLENSKLDSEFILGVLDADAATPIFNHILESLKSKLGSNLKIVILNRENRREMFTPKFDGFLSFIGITPGDPIPHFAFLQEARDLFRESIPRSAVEEVVKSQNLEEFHRRAIAFEEKVISNRLLVPIGHFPGVIAYPRTFQRDEKLAWSWGLQAWTFRIGN